MPPTNWTLAELVDAGRAIWGPDHLDLTQVVVRLTVNVGKLARLARGATKDQVHDVVDPQLPLKVAMGHIIVSMVRWCDDLGLDPSECCNKALLAQHKFALENPER